jgi:hypothetical protein
MRLKSFLWMLKSSWLTVASRWAKMSKKQKNSSSKCPKRVSKSWTKSKQLAVWRPNQRCNNSKCKTSKWKFNTFFKSNQIWLSKRRNWTGANPCSKKDPNSTSTNPCHLKFWVVWQRLLQLWKTASWLKRNHVKGKLRTSLFSWNWLNALKKSWLIKFKFSVKILLKFKNLPIKLWQKWKTLKFKTTILCRLWWGNRCSQRIAKLTKRRQCWSQDKTRRMCLSMRWSSINRVGQSWVKFNLLKLLMISLNSGNEEPSNDRFTYFIFNHHLVN